MKIATVFSCLIAMSLPALTSAQAWDPITTLDSNPHSSFTGPVVDSLGNAWMLIDDNVSLSVVESNGTSGAWQAPHILGPGIAEGAGIAVDQSGGVYVAYNGAAIGAGPPYSLMWAKYTPATGWQGPRLAYNSPDNFFLVFPAIDSEGRLVVVFYSNAGGLESIVYDPATSSWGRVQKVSRNVPTGVTGMAANASGTQLVAAYLGRTGLLYSLYNHSTAKWSAPAPIPGSEQATFNAGAGGTHLQMAVDASGNVIVMSEMKAGRGEYTVAGFRYNGSGWQETVLLPPSPYSADLENSGSTALAPDGSLLVAVPIGSNTGVNITVFRYTSGVGWDTETAAAYASSTATKCAVAWFASGDAVAVYLNFADADAEQAVIYRNGSWTSGPPIPTGYNTVTPGLATASNGDVLLGMSSDGFEYNYGTVATWLRP
jgi:hypothetical protein